MRSALTFFHTTRRVEVRASKPGTGTGTAVHGSMPRSLDCFGPVDRMAVDNEKILSHCVVHQSLAEVDESGGFELTRVG